MMVGKVVDEGVGWTVIVWEVNNEGLKSGIKSNLTIQYTKKAIIVWYLSNTGVGHDQ